MSKTALVTYLHAGPCVEIQFPNGKSIRRRGVRADSLVEEIARNGIAYGHFRKLETAGDKPTGWTRRFALPPGLKTNRGIEKRFPS